MKNSKIEWTHHTFNPWIGCTKISPACDNCYAAVSTPARTMKISWGAGQPRKLTSEANWREPLRWNADCEKQGVRERVFCASLADVFDNEVPAQWRAKLLNLIAETPHLDWLLLTKRIGNANRMLDDYIQSDGHVGLKWIAWPNVWIGATICNQEEADRDIPKLLQVPAQRRFLSMEPLLSSVYLDGRDGHVEALAGWWRRVDWIILGGESGTKARPMHLEWVTSLRDQCAAAQVPFFFKQWGEWCPRGPESQGYSVVEGVNRLRMTNAGRNGQDLGSEGGNDVWMNRAGKKTTGRMLGGREWNEVPS